MYDWVKKDLKDFGNYISQSSDIESLSSQEIDLAFIGAGLSSTYTLIEFVRQIENNKNIPNCDDDHKAYKIAVFEKDSWIWGGIPYGRRSSFTSLIITPLDEFLPEFEVNEFIDWMSLNFSWLIVPFKKNAGERSKQWLLESEEKIISGKSARIHIPRYFFGIYIWEKLQKIISQTNKKIEINFVNAEIASIENRSTLKKSSFEILTGNNIRFNSNQVLLGIGIPQIRSLNKNNKDFSDLLYLNDPYFPDLESSLNLIRNKLSQNNSSKILIVGANASALELIYQITNLKGFDRFNISFSVIAPQGKLPGLFIKDKKTDFIAEELQNLSESNDNLTADLILESLRKDLSYADENKYLISDTLPVFTQHVGKLVNLLTKEEKLKFISFHGVEIGRLQRRAGQEYIEPVKDLMKQKKLNIIKGKFISFVKENKSTMVEFKKNNENISQQSRYDIVINCSGSSGLNNKNISPLLNQLKNSGLCTPTSSNHGFIVGDNFDVLPGLYINGPLLAGNVVGDMGIWHVEHCGRIISFAKKIAKIIIENDKFITNQKSIL
jgi:uncharacterized NAD(P)/FAD-binding protein YdhS